MLFLWTEIVFEIVLFEIIWKMPFDFLSHRWRQSLFLSQFYTIAARTEQDSALWYFLTLTLFHIKKVSFLIGLFWWYFVYIWVEEQETPEHEPMQMSWNKDSTIATIEWSTSGSPVRKKLFTLIHQQPLRLAAMTPSADWGRVRQMNESEGGAGL